MSAEVELLREAARVMRERAQAATPGPWESKAGYPHIVWQPRVGGEEFILSANLSERPDADAAHIASWHPAVALAVADWLEAVAEYQMGDTNELESAETVARAYLGRRP